MTAAVARGGATARDRALARLHRERFDLLVVGAGATGAGVARDAALRGLSVALVDHGDFAGETSSRSSKLIHGGIRYLEYGDFPLVFEALRERRNLMRTAPHLCRPIEFIFPAYRGESPGIGMLTAGVVLYNALALWRPPARGRRLSPDETHALAPGLRSADLRGALLYTDCQTDDARLVLETALDAEDVGAVLAPRVTITRLRRNRRGRVDGARARDRLSGDELDVEADVVVNATGPFSDAFDRGRHNLRPTLGVHLVFDAARLPHDGRAIVLRQASDKRIVFLLPAGPRTIVGTTDTDWTRPTADRGPPLPGDDIEARAPDVAYLLDIVNGAFPATALRPEDVISTYAGLRPLFATSAQTPSSTSREHEIVVEGDGLLTIVGGKLTTHRAMAEQVVDRAVELLRARGREGALAPCSTGWRPLPGGHEGPVSLGDIELAPDIEEHLRRTYGSRASSVASCMRDESAHADLSARIDADLPYVWAEVMHAARYERVTAVEDVLRRRVPVFRDARDQGLAAAPIAAAIVAELLAWSPEQRARSLAEYQAAVSRARAWQRAI